MVFPRGSAFLIGAVLMLAACQAGEEPNVLGTDGLTMAGAGSVRICHFRGHEIDDEGLIRHDYVTDETDPPGSTSQCGQQGGNIIQVSQEACENGHGINSVNCGTQ